jgi:deoxyribonuclease V
MRLYPCHKWNLGYHEATALQSQLAARIRLRPLSLRSIRRVAGADIAVSKPAGIGVGAVVVFEFPSLEIVEERVARVALSFPYIPGLLSFREIPVLVECLRKVRVSFDVMLCDGQGIAHPRGFGLASHLGYLLRKPTIGCAKSLLVGESGDPGPHRGDFSPLWHKGRKVGNVLRTQDGVKPVYVSPGHLVDHASSRRIVLACATRYRIPEPTRQADRVAGEEKRRLEAGRPGV